MNSATATAALNSVTTEDLELAIAFLATDLAIRTEDDGSLDILNASLPDGEMIGAKLFMFFQKMSVEGESSKPEAVALAERIAPAVLQGILGTLQKYCGVVLPAEEPELEAVQ